MNIIDGKKQALILKEQLKTQVEKLDVIPKLVIISAGDDLASKVYMHNKLKYASDISMIAQHLSFDKDVEQSLIASKVQEVANDETVHGIIIQLPLPDHLDADHLMQLIPKEKDVDGFSSHNLGELILDNDNAHIPCTPAGILHLLDVYNIDVVGKNVTIVGRSNIVGKPLAVALINRSATVTVCNSKTQNLKEHTKQADIVIVATGHINTLSVNDVKFDAVIIDVGINRDKDGKLTGDVDYQSFENSEDFKGLITPVPGGVGPMTVAHLIKNTINAVNLLK